MKKLERLSGIIYALRENKKMTAKELAEVFEVSERTIYRDIDALSQLKVPIVSFEGFEGGYKIDESYFIPSLNLEQNEILYLLICLRAGEVLRVPNMKGSFESLKYKLLNILDDDMKQRFKKLLSRIMLEMNRIVPSNYCENLFYKLIESFIDYKDLVIIYYSPKSDEYIKRRVTPYFLSFDSGGWYLDGYCHIREAMRCFRLDRIKDIEVSHEDYKQSFVDEYINKLKNKEKAFKIKLEMDKKLYEIVKNDESFIDGQTKNLGDKIELSINTNNIDYFVSLAIENWNQVTIIEPKECINRIKKLCNKTLQKY
ncbi:helix-turn-helix transcriptional regulator [Abyssisolibacter fermentans]|uniref:helix-turn-helix transcriptional regulator n=1 Tax=Abyssisolibacter fermentans TaxID=1766203 RepID=UPI00082AAE8D|nr:YafY family protein [Abyssisolibacter fermentans]